MPTGRSGRSNSRRVPCEVLRELPVGLGEDGRPAALVLRRAVGGRVEVDGDQRATVLDELEPADGRTHHDRAASRRAQRATVLTGSATRPSRAGTTVPASPTRTTLHSPVATLR